MYQFYRGIGYPQLSPIIQKVYCRFQVYPVHKLISVCSRFGLLARTTCLIGWSLNRNENETFLFDISYVQLVVTPAAEIGFKGSAEPAYCESDKMLLFATKFFSTTFILVADFLLSASDASLPTASKHTQQVSLLLLLSWEGFHDRMTLRIHMAKRVFHFQVSYQQQ
jgi:hypothetical protein